MANTQIRNVAIVGTGLIGASWAAQYLASGLDVIATDPAPNAEASLRKSVDEAWKLLTEIGLASGASRDRLTFTADIKEAVSKADFVQESVPERPALESQGVLPDGRSRSSGHDPRFERIRYHHGCHPVEL